MRNILFLTCGLSVRHATVTLLLLLVGAPVTQANPNSGITYHGRIVRPDGRPLEGAQVQFRLQIRTPGAENCLLFEETQSKDMRLSNGVFSLTINDGNGVRGADSGHALERVFQNRGSFSGLPNCANGSGYIPNEADGRRFVVAFRDESMGSWEPLPPSLINFVPLAIESRSVGGFHAKHLLRVTDNGTESGNPQDAPVLSASEASELKALAAGTSTRYMQSSSGGGAALPSYQTLTPPASPVAGSVWYDSDAKAIKFFDGTNPVTLGTGGGGGSGTVTSVTAGDGLSGGTFTVSGTISLPDVGTAGTYYKVVTDAKGRVTSGSSSLAETDLPTISTPSKVSGSAIASGEISGTTSIDTSGAIRTTGAITSGSHSTRLFDLYDSDNTHRIRFQTPATEDLTADYTLTWPETAGSSGQVLTTNGAGILSWQSVSGSPTGAAGGDLDGTYPDPVLRSIVTAGTGTKISYDAKGRVTSSAALDATDIPNLNWSKITAGKPSTLLGYGITDAVLNAGGVTSVQSGDDADKPAPATAGLVYFAVDTQKIYRDNGTSWELVASNGAGGGGGGTVTGVTASAPLSSSGGVAPNITISQASGSTSGYLSSADWNTFNSKLGAVTGSSLNEGEIWVGNGSNQAAPVTPSGDVSMSNAGSFTVTGIRGHVVSATAPTLSGQVLRYDDVAASYAPAFLSLADIRSTTSPFNPMFPNTSCTAAQTLNWSSLTDTLTCTSIAIDDSAVTFQSRAAGQVFAGPTTGPDAAPVFRSLVENDIPDLNASKITDGTLPIARGGTGSIDGSITGSGALSFTAGGTDQNIILSPSGAGKVGIGTLTPHSLLQVAGGIQIGADSADCDADKAGALRYNSGNVEYCNGASWAAFGVSGAGITAFNGASQSSQSFATPGNSGLAPNWSTNVGTGVHTLNIPLASSADVTAGLISKADYDTFNAKLGTVTGSTLNEGEIWVGNGSNQAASIAPAGDVSMSNAGSFTITKLRGSAISTVVPDTMGQMLRWNQGTSEWEASTDGSALTSINASNISSGTLPITYGGTGSSDGSITGSGALNFAAGGGDQSITLTPSGAGYTILNGNVGIGTTTPQSKLQVAGGVQVGVDGATCDSDKSGTIHYTGGNLQFCNGSSWQTLGVSGAGLTSLNGQTGGSQAFAVDTAGSNFEFSSSSDTHTLNIPMASVAGVSAGLISKTDYDNFNSKQAAGNYITALTGDVTASGPGSATATIANKAVTYSKIQDIANDRLLGRSTAGAGPVEEISLGTGLDLSNGVLSATNGNAGTVTSVDVSVPSYMSSTGGPVTDSGTITLGFETQAQNSVFAGPASGGTGAASFRALDPSDIPDLSAAKITSGTLDVARGGTGLAPVAGDANKVYGINATGDGSEFKAITGGSGVTITHSAGGIEISAASSGGTVTNIATGTGLTGGPITGDGTISIADDGVGTTQLADGAVSAAKIGDGQVTGAKLEDSGVTADLYGSATTVPVLQIDAKGRITSASSTSITGLLPTGTSGQFLKSSGGSSWASSDIRFSDIKNIAGTSAFDITSCSANQTVAWSSLTDSFSCQNIGSLNASAITAGTLDIARIPVGTSASTVAAGDDSRFPASTCGSGNVSRWDGSTWQCETASATDATKVAKTGDTMTGALNLPANGLAVGTDQLVVSGGNVGIGAANPDAKLEVAGMIHSTSGGIKFPDGSIQATAATGGDGGVDVQVFDTSGTWTKPATGNLVRIQCWGGGGGGGRVSGNNNGGGGGGGGAYAEKTILTSTLPATVDVTVGAGGAGRSSNGNGGDGGATTFGSYLTIYGGAGGISTNGGGGGGALGPGSGSAGGDPDGGDLGSSSAFGGGGGSGVTGGGSAYGGGGGGGSNKAGGSSVMGGGGGGGVSSGSGGVSANGGNGGAGSSDGQWPGGGGGGTKSGTSGNGAAGGCIVMTF